MVLRKRSLSKSSTRSLWLSDWGVGIGSAKDEPDVPKFGARALLLVSCCCFLGRTSACDVFVFVGWIGL